MRGISKFYVYLMRTEMEYNAMQKGKSGKGGGDEVSWVLNPSR